MSEKATLELRLPATVARVAGALWLVSVVSGIFAEVFVRGVMIVHGDAVATAVKITAGERMFRVGFVADLIGDVSYLGATLLLTVLLKPVSRAMALVMLGFGLAGSAVMAASLVNLLAPVILLHTIGLSAGAGSVLTPLVLLFLRLHSLGYSVSIALFSVQIGVMGILILRSNLFPHLFGVLFLIEAACNTISSFGDFLDLEWVGRLGTYILLPGLPAEGGFTLWLLVFGVNSLRSTAADEAQRSVRLRTKGLDS